MFEVSDDRRSVFRAASGRVYTRDTATGNTIGVQSERMLHLILKYFLVPDDTCHEIRVGRYWADAMREGHIYEIQTRRFDRLREKLAVFLEEHDVTVVYPIAASKTVAWVDSEAGTMTKPRRSPKKRTIYDCFYELFFIREFLIHPHFHFCAILCEMEEFRSLTGYGPGKKRRAPRLERIPTSLVGEAYFASPVDYACLIPPVLGETFTTPEFTKATGIPSSAAWRAVQVLVTLGLIREDGREGRAKRWARVNRSSHAEVCP